MIVCRGAVNADCDSENDSCITYNYEVLQYLTCVLTDHFSKV
jgi:hypothetical protein